MADAGVLDLIGLAVTVAIALPLAVFGAEQVLAGQTWGVAFLALAGLLVVVEQLLVTPGDIPERLLGAAVGRVAEEPDEE